MLPLTTSIECEEYLRSIWEKNTIRCHERVYVVFFNYKMQRIFSALINKGCFSSTDFDKWEVLQYAKNVHSEIIVIAHNHPNGYCSPSEKDIEATKEIVLALSLFEVQVMDHIILTHDKYFSFKDMGLMGLSLAVWGLGMIFN